jgi:hypothetical protein
VLSLFDVGYLLMQAVGEFLADWFGGKIGLGLGACVGGFLLS